MKKNDRELPINKVFNYDVLHVLQHLPSGSVDCVYGDPDYNVGVHYNGKEYTKGFEEYVRWYVELARESLRVLKENGNMFLMNYPKQNAHLRVKYLDQEKDVYDVHEYVWIYNTNVGHTPKRFTTAHRSILHVRKSPENNFYKDQVAQPYKNPTDPRILKNLANGSKGRMPYSWFYFDLVKNVSREKTFHACQIPAKLTEMLFLSCTKPNDIIFVLFGGSGSEVAVCQRLQRHFITAEIDDKYYRMILDRISKNGSIDPKYAHPARKRRASYSARTPGALPRSLFEGRIAYPVK